MIEWIGVLEILAVVMASIAVVIAFAVLVNFARQALRQVKPKLVPLKKERQDLSYKIVLELKNKSFIRMIKVSKR